MEVISQSYKPRVLSCWGHSETRPGNRIPNMADGTRRREGTKTKFPVFELLRESRKKLDDGWPESVEEQSLLLLVWKHDITRQYIKIY